MTWRRRTGGEGRKGEGRKGERREREGRTCSHGRPGVGLAALVATCFLAGGSNSAAAATLGIGEIQGHAHHSPYTEQWVETAGVVTVVAGNGFYLRDLVTDREPGTSDAIFVYTASLPEVLPGDWIEIAGRVSEYFPGGVWTGNLSTTELVEAQVVRIVEHGLALPPPARIGVGGRQPPSEVIDDDALTSYDPELDGIDFYESFEGMRVELRAARAVSAQNVYGEVWVVVDDGAGSSGLNQRGGITVGPGDANPERIQIDFDRLLTPDPPAHVGLGDELGDVVGVVSYGYGSYEVRVTEPLAWRPAGLEREVSPWPADAASLRVASFNVENLSPGDTARLSGLARQIVDHLLSPDILALQEIQDDDGPIDSGTTTADATYQALIDAVIAAGGPEYRALDIPPVDGQDGGQPGANIRVAFLYDPIRIEHLPGSLTRLGGGGAFTASRKPLVGRFRAGGVDLTLINNHFTSRGGSEPLFGAHQPPKIAGAERRTAQARVVAEHVVGLVRREPGAHVIVLGDLNALPFEAALETLTTAVDGGMPVLWNTSDRLAPAERYSYVYRGNAQQLDHILLTAALFERAEVDVVHVNAEFANSASDHDPVMIRLDMLALPEPAAALQALVMALTLAGLRRARVPRGVRARAQDPTAQGE